MNSRQLTTPERLPMDDGIWTTEEVAQYLKVSEDTVRSEAKKGKIPGASKLAAFGASVRRSFDSTRRRMFCCLGQLPASSDSAG